MFDLGFALIIADLILAYCIHELHKHNDKVYKVISDPNPHLLTEETSRKRLELKIDMFMFYFLFVLMVGITIIFYTAYRSNT